MQERNGVMTREGERAAAAAARGARLQAAGGDRETEGCDVGRAGA